MAARRFTKAWFAEQEAARGARAAQRSGEIEQLSRMRRRTMADRSRLATLQRIERRQQAPRISKAPPVALLERHIEQHHIRDGAKAHGHETDVGYLRNFVVEHPVGSRVLLEDAKKNYEKFKSPTFEKRYEFRDPQDYDDEFPDDWREEVPELTYYH